LLGTPKQGDSPAGRGLRLVALLLVWVTAACSAVGAVHPSGEDPVSAKIQLDLSGLDEDGLYGPPNGLRALSYEFCIPARETLADDVRAIDHTIQLHRGSRGRIGCTNEQYLCVGSTHQPGYRTVLRRLAELEYVTRINPSYAE
jgi:hypothetical protein